MILARTSHLRAILYRIVRVCTDTNGEKQRREDICSIDNSLFEILHLWNPLMNKLV